MILGEKHLLRGKDIKLMLKNMIGNKIDVSKIDLEKEKDKTTESPGLIEYAHHSGSAIIKPEDKGRIKGNAVAAMYEQTDRQLKQLQKQMQLLITQANSIKKRVEVSERIYQATISFTPLIGKTYYLYEKKNQQDVLSMVSPEEWGASMPYESFIAKAILLSDHTWEVS